MNVMSLEAGPKSGAVRRHLRAATEEMHLSLHRAAPFAAIAGGQATLADYGGILRFLYRYHTAMAPVCTAGAAALGAEELAYAHAARLDRLAHDLSGLGFALPACATGAAGESGFCAGALYTVQGSTMGGKVIFRQLDYLLADARGRSFFQGGAEDGRNWRLLCDALERRRDVAAMEAGARHAFQSFAQMLTDHPIRGASSAT